MEVVGSLFGSHGGSVLALLIGSFFIIKLLSLSSTVAVAAAGLPLSLYLIDAPLISQLRTEHPTVALCGAWCATALLGLLWRGVSPLWAGLVGNTGVIRQAYLAGLCAALLVVAMLLVAPELLLQYAPGWRSTVGGVLLFISLISVSKAIAQMLKAGALLVLWSAVALVLASQVFLHKMPYALERADVTRLESLLTSESARGTFRALLEALNGRYTLGRVVGILSPILPEVRRVVTEAPEELSVRQAGLVLGQKIKEVPALQLTYDRQDLS
jgi:hypothetical protein